MPAPQQEERRGCTKSSRKKIFPWRYNKRKRYRQNRIRHAQNDLVAKLRELHGEEEFPEDHVRIPDEMTVEELIAVLEESDTADIARNEKGTEDEQERIIENKESDMEQDIEHVEEEQEVEEDQEKEHIYMEEDDEELEINTNIDAGRLDTSNIEGRRIVDLNYFLKEMHEKFDNHHRGIECRFADLVVVGSRQHGLRTQIEMQCRMCLYKDKIWTEPEESHIMDINHSAVAGTIMTGIGYSQLQELLATMNIPCMSEKKYQKCHANVAKGFKEAAEQEMKAAGNEERILAIKRGDIIDGVPHIPVVADGSWMKRSYRTGKYDSSSGVGAIVGYHTKKILFIGVRNKYCSVCDYAVRKEEEAREHVCYKNWGKNQSSTSMESDAIVEGFKCSLAMHGLIYSTLIADGDSSVYKRIIDANPYFNVHVRKIECTNHLLRNLAHRIKEISKIKGRFGKWRSIVENSVLRIRTAVVKAAEFRAKENPPTNRKAQKLREDIQNITSHVFGEHKNCAKLQYFCDGTPKEGEENIVQNLKDIGLFPKLQDCLVNISCYADSLLYNMNSNAVESYNGIVCKFIGGKRINFGKRGSYETRCAGAVVQYNTQTSCSRLSEAMKKDAPTISKKLEEQRKRKVEITANSKSKMKKLKYSKQTPDEDYGPNAQRPDLDITIYEEQVKFHNEILLEWQRDRHNIERQTTQQSKCEKWLSCKRKLLTASNFGKVCKMRENTSCQNITKRILYPQLLQVPAVEYGREREDAARKQLEEKIGKRIERCGLFIDQDIPFLGASPDGLIDEDGIVEIKCPFSAKDLTPDEAIKQKIGQLYTVYNAASDELNIKHDYYYQVQGQLHITGRAYCVFCIWTPKGKLQLFIKTTHFGKRKCTVN